MFKLIKILNSGTNVPEPCRLPKTQSLKIKIGMPLIITDGKLAACSATDKPTHIALANATASESYAICYEISKDMYFETVSTAVPSALILGKAYTLAADSDGFMYGITATANSGVATVVDICNAKNAGDTVTVKFN